MKTNTTDKTVQLAMTGLLTAMVVISIMILPIPIPMTTGYVNLGDGIIFLAVLLLGWKYGAFVGGVGAAMADILLGAAAWAPWTLVIKGGMALIVGMSMKLSKGTKNDGAIPSVGIVGMIFASIFMAGGYYLAESVMYGNWVAPMVGIIWNLLQGAVGIVIASVLAVSLKKTPAKKYFQ